MRPQTWRLLFSVQILLAAISIGLACFSLWLTSESARQEETVWVVAVISAADQKQHYVRVEAEQECRQKAADETIARYAVGYPAPRVLCFSMPESASDRVNRWFDKYAPWY